MLFLGFVADWISSVGDGIMGAIESGIRTLSFSLATFIYELIINLYNLFEKLCSARLLDNSLLEKLSQRIGLILGLIMFFYIAFSFIKMMIDPSLLDDKKKNPAAIVKKTLLVIVMLGASNFVFETLYYVQKVVIEDHIISKLLLPYNLSEDDLNNFGNILSEELMSAFYQVKQFSSNEVANGTENDRTIKLCTNMTNSFRNQIINQGQFELGRNCLNESVKININTGTGTETQETFVIDYNWALCIIVGAVVVYLIFMYCLKVGVRMVQLMFLEIISPMAIVSYLSLKDDNMFTKWSKIYVATYIDVFIRVVIINFVIFLIATILSTNVKEGMIFWDTVGNPEGGDKTFFMVVIILALLTFAKKAPELLKELLPASASKLGFGASMKDIVGLEKGTAIGAGILGGAVSGAVGGAVGGALAGKSLTKALGGAASGLFRGGLGGIKNKSPFDLTKSISGGYSRASDAAIKNVQRLNAGGSSNPFARALSNPNLARLEGEIEKNKQIQSYLNEAKTKAKSEALKKGANYVYDVGGGHIANGKTLSELAVLKDSQTVSDNDRILYTEAYNKLEGFATDFNLEYGGVAKTGQVYFNSAGEINGVMQEMEDGSDFRVITDYSEIVESNSTISSGMERILANSDVEVKQGERVKTAKDISKKAEDNNNRIISSKEYIQAKADAHHGGKK